MKIFACLNGAKILGYGHFVPLSLHSKNRVISLRNRIKERVY